jgi:hypothetical protein
MVDHLAVACPYCEAPPGERCRGGGGFLLPTHAKRIREAKLAAYSTLGEAVDAVLDNEDPIDHTDEGRRCTFCGAAVLEEYPHVKIRHESNCVWIVLRLARAATQGAPDA